MLLGALGHRCVSCAEHDIQGLHSHAERWVHVHERHGGKEFQGGCARQGAFCFFFLKSLPFFGCQQDL